MLPVSWWGGEYGTTGTTTYYRLDFLENDRATYKDILRNHLYRFTIMGVSGAGHTSPDEAFQAIPLNMEAEILEWDESEMPVVVFDGQYMLSVNQEAFTFSREVTTTADKHNLLLIYTDYDVAPNAGWKIEKIVDAADTDISGIWLNADNWSGLPNTKSAVHLLLQENTTGAPRTGYIHITAGRLSYIVTVTQSEQSGFSLTLYEGTGSTGKEITELVFSGRASEITAQQFTLEWLPKTESPQINVRQTGNAPFAFGSGSDQLTDNTSIDASVYPNGSRIYTILPPAMTAAETDPALGGNPFLEKSSRIDFTINNGTNYLTKNIFLRQISYGISFEIDDIYVLDGREHSFTVKSNTTWTATITDNPNNIIQQLITTSGGNNMAGQEVKFRTYNDLLSPSIYEGTAEITFTSLHFDPVVVEIHCGSGRIVPKSNSYIVKPGGLGILIPVDRANDHKAGAISTTADFRANLEWTDNPNIIGNNSNIRLITESGTGSNGHILVFPGTAEGNAVVSVSVGSGADSIKWSWHIWVADYNPVSDHTSNNGNRFMDRNLGALSNTPGEIGTLGLLYQWGRKDPFPGSANVTVATEPTLYNLKEGSFGMLKVAAPTTTAGTNNLDNSIQNPKTFYGTPSLPDDWYTTVAGNGNNDLWGHESTKTIYDPCPEGWRIPSFSGSEPPWYWNASDFPWTTNGRVYNSSYYPGAGCRSYTTSGELIRVGTFSYYWSASPYEDEIRILFFNSDFIYHGYQVYRAYGASVRCM